MAGLQNGGLLSRLTARKSVAQVRSESENSELKRTLGPWNLLFLGVG
jgi:APA family basic amino acid/polyamine antiporter